MSEVCIRNTKYSLVLTKAIGGAVYMRGGTGRRTESRLVYINSLIFITFVLVFRKSLPVAVSVGKIRSRKHVVLEKNNKLD